MHLNEGLMIIEEGQHNSNILTFFFSCEKSSSISYNLWYVCMYVCMYVLSPKLKFTFHLLNANFSIQLIELHPVYTCTVD